MGGLLALAWIAWGLLYGALLIVRGIAQAIFYLTWAALLWVATLWTRPQREKPPKDNDHEDA